MGGGGVRACARGCVCVCEKELSDAKLRVALFGVPVFTKGYIILGI